MADTWITPEKKKSLLDYVDQLKKISGGPIEEEDLYAAGFSEKDLEESGWNTPNPKATPLDGDGSKVEAYSPTSRDNLRNNVRGTLEGVGFERDTAQSVAKTIAGEENPTDGGLGMGVADFTPFGALFGVEEGIGAAKRGYNSGDALGAGAGVLNAGLSVASALPGGAVVSKGVQKLSEKLAGQYDPSVVRTFFGPNSVKADWKKLDKAESMEANGSDPRQIWKDTGWWKGPNGWRFEVDDSKLSLPDTAPGYTIRGPNEAMFSNPDYWDATKSVNNYENDRATDIARGTATLQENDFGNGNLGAFDPSDRSVKVSGKTYDERKQTAVHELQHAVQSIFGDEGAGANPEYIGEQFALAFDNVPVELKPAVRTAADFGYANARYDTLKSRYQDLVNSNASPAYVRKIETDVSAALDETIRLEDLVKDYEQEYPEFSTALGEFRTLGEGAGYEYLSSHGTNAAIETKTMFDPSGTKLQSWVSDTLYRTEAGELEARIAGSRANMTPEQRAESFPEDYIDLYHPQESVYKMPNFTGWLKNTANEANDVVTNKKAQRGYAEGGAVQEVDPVSGNAVPPGAEPVEVRDDIDAKLSDGEYVIPADVVRYLGLDKIEQLVAKAKDGLAEMDAKGRIGGKPVEEEDDLPFTDEELLGDTEPVKMATGGMVTNTMGRGMAVTPPPTPPTGSDMSLPPWMQDEEEKKPGTGGRTPQEIIAERKSNNNSVNKDNSFALTGTARSVGDWDVKDFGDIVKNRTSPAAAVMETGIKSMIPFGGLALAHKNKHIDKQVPIALESMLSSGVDLQGNPLSPEQMDSLRQTQTEFAKTIGYQPGIGGRLKGTVKDRITSLIGKKDKKKAEDTVAKAPDKKAETEKAAPAKESGSKESNKDKNDKDKNKDREKN
jgi:hypothetical protein